MTLCPCLHAGDLHSYSLGLLSSIVYTLNRQQILPENSKCSLLACSLLSCPVKLPTNPHLTTCHIAVAYCTHNNVPQGRVHPRWYLHEGEGFRTTSSTRNRVSAPKLDSAALLYAH